MPGPASPSTWPTPRASTSRRSTFHLANKPDALQLDVQTAVHPLSAGIDTKGRATLSARSLTAGTYAITVRDRSRSAGFRLTGPGLNRRTGTTFTGSVTWKATLQKGTYRYGVDGARTLRTLVVS